MKNKNKKIAVCAILVGAAILTTSALADAVIGSGYSALKTSLKNTTRYLANDAQSLACDVGITLREGDTVYTGNTFNSKIDRTCGREATESTDIVRGSTSYYYHDAGMTVSSDSDGKKHVIMLDGDFERSDTFSHDPFDEEQVADLEKVADAFVGSLQNVVDVSENGGHKKYTCALNSSQLPLYVNAFSSVALKYSLFNESQVEEDGLPLIKNDIYISDASAKVSANENDILTDAVLTVDFSGNDAQGIQHKFTAEFVMSIYDINNVTVDTPDTTGAEITYASKAYRTGISSFDEGVYTYPITDTKDGKTQKIGTTVLEIASVDDSGISGRFYETYEDDSAPENPLDFSFSTPWENEDADDAYGVELTYYQNGEEKTALLEKIDNVQYRIEFDVRQHSRGGYSSDETKTVIRDFER